MVKVKHLQVECTFYSCFELMDVETVDCVETKTFIREFDFGFGDQEVFILNGKRYFNVPSSLLDLEFAI